MKKTSKLLAISFCIVANGLIYSQENVVKVGLLGIANKNVKLTYERVLTDRMSVQVSGSFLLPRTMPDRFTDALASNDDSGTAGGNTNVVSSSVMKGISIIPELRIYSKKKEGAPRGFYYGPYFKYSNYSVSYDGSFEGVKSNVVGSMRTFGFGLQLGSQWLIANRVSIDWHFLAIGFNFNNFGLDYSSNQVGVDFDQWGEEISKGLKDIPVIGNKMNFSTTGKGFQINAPFMMPAIRSGLSIGFAF
jgi:hypothetical protein